MPHIETKTVFMFSCMVVKFMRVGMSMNMILQFHVCVVVNSWGSYLEYVSNGFIHYAM